MVIMHTFCGIATIKCRKPQKRCCIMLVGLYDASMETDIQKIENRIRGAGYTIAAFCEEYEIPRRTWAGWKMGALPRIDTWKRVLEAVEKLEQ